MTFVTPLVMGRGGQGVDIGSNGFHIGNREKGSSLSSDGLGLWFYGFHVFLCSNTSKRQ